MTKIPFGNMGNIMKQAQAMQEQLAKLQEQAAGKTVEGTAGGGMVTVTATRARRRLSRDPGQRASGRLHLRSVRAFVRGRLRVRKPQGA